jgi:hypothetical protein
MGAVGDRTILVPTPYVKEHGFSESDERGVIREVTYFLPLNGKGPHFPNARSWNQTRITSGTADAGFFFFQLQMLQAETESEGSMHPIISREADPEEYEKLVIMTARRLRKKTSPAEQKILDRMLVSDHWVDLRFIHDVEHAKNVLKTKNTATAASASATATAVDYFTPAAPFPSSMEAEGEESALDALYAWAGNLAVVEERQEALPPKKPKKRSKKDDEAADINAIEYDSMPPAPPFTGEFIKVPKIQFTVTPMPSANDPEEISGLLCRFLIRDPQINPGTFFKRVLVNLHGRNARLMSGGNRGGGGQNFFKELFPHYAMLYYTNHPAGMNVTRQTYMLSALKMSPEAGVDPAGRKTRAQIMAELDFENFDSPIHLFNLLTMTRARDEMRSAGVRPDLISFDWYDPVVQVARFPLPTYKYHEEQVFWYHSTNVGLREQLFPHIDLETDFLSSLMAGANVNRFLSESNLLEDEQAEKKLSTVFEKMRLLLRDQYVVKRSELLATNLLTYKTNNEFVHRAAEAETIVKRVNQEWPAHYSATHSEVQKIITDWKGDDWRAHVYGDLAERVAECERFNAIRNKAQLACLKSFCGLWPTEGDIDSLPIPDSIKAMQRWYRDNQSSMFPNVTREFTMWDPDLGLFGNR